jgi:signal transduction histidine kinase
MTEEYLAAAGASGLALVTATHPDLPVIATSRVRVRQIVSNLLSNAIKYTPHGSVTVRTAHQCNGPQGAPGEWLLVEVADTGPGIPAEKQEYIFEEFSRIGPRDKSGAGLGLAISRLLAQALGGQITVESTGGSGSTFRLWLPLQHAA